MTSFCSLKGLSQLTKIWAPMPDGNLRFEITADGIDATGLFACQAENDGDVVGSEGPEDVLLPADLAEAEAAGGDVLEAADGSLVDQLLQADHGCAFVNASHIVTTVTALQRKMNHILA
jgi:hypothetical protein